MIERRDFLTLASAITLQALFRSEATADTASHPPVRRILLVHGRDQQGIDPVKREIFTISSTPCGVLETSFRTLPP
jgi:hypothetical protein